MECYPGKAVPFNYSRSKTKLKVFGDIEATGSIAGAGTIVPAADSITNAMLKSNIVQGKNIVDGTITGAKIAANALSADGSGRARMETGFFSEAKATDAFAAGAIVGTLLKDGALSADATGRAKMATGFFTETKATDAFAAQAVTTALLKAGLLSADAAGRGKMADDYFTTAEMVAGAGGKFATGCFDATGLANLLATGAFTAAVAVQGFGNGVVPTLGNQIADPGNGNPIPVTASGTCLINASGAGQNRTLADPGALGTMLVLVHDQGANANTVTCASDITKNAGQNVIHFTAAFGETVILHAIKQNNALKWRLMANPDGLTID